jgi:ATP-dependent DNA ligase
LTIGAHWRRQPTLVTNPPTGSGWLHEVKHDGFRAPARKRGERVEVWSRVGTDFTGRFWNIAEAVCGLLVESALIDRAAVFRVKRLEGATACDP